MVRITGISPADVAWNATARQARALLQAKGALARAAKPNRLFHRMGDVAGPPRSRLRVSAAQSARGRPLDAVSRDRLVVSARGVVRAG